MGLVWFTTDSNIYRWDSVTLTAVPLEKNGHEIKSNRAVGIIQDSQGTLWLASDTHGLFFYNRRKERFVHAALSYTNQQTNKPPTNVISCFSGIRDQGYNAKCKEKLEDALTTGISAIDIDKSDLLILGSKNGLLYLFHPYKGTLRTITISKYANENIRSVTSANDKDIWIASSSGLHTLSLKKGKFTTVFTDAPANTVALDNHGRLWMTADDGRIVRFDNDRKTTRIENLPAGTLIYDAAFWRGNLVVATDLGLWFYDLLRDNWTALTSRNSKLSNSHIISLYAGKQTLWVGSYQGLNIVNANTFARYDARNSQIHNEIMAFSEDDHHRLWLGTYDGLFVSGLEDSSTHQFTRVDDMLGLTSPRIMAMAVDHKQRLWLSLRDQGVKLIDINTIQILPPPPALERPEAVTGIVHDEKGNTWLSTYGNGVFRFGKRHELLTHYHTDSETNNGITSDYAHLVYSGLNDSIYVAAENSLFCRTGETQNFVPIALKQEPANTETTRVMALVKYRDQLWVGTDDDGIIQLQVDSQCSVKHIAHYRTTNTALPSDAIYALQFVEDGVLWGSTNTGIFALDTTDLSIQSYSPAYGLQGGEFNFGASYKHDASTLYFGGSQGFNIVETSAREITQSPSKVHLSQIVTPQYALSPTSPLSSVELDFRDYFVTFRFSVLSYANSEENRFRYQLLGVDPQWIESGKQNSVTYSRLKPGQYTLKIQGANAFGIWNTEGLSISIVVLTPPWQTTWAYIIYALFALAVIALIKSAYERAIIAKNAQASAAQLKVAADHAVNDLHSVLEAQTQLLQSAHQGHMNMLSVVQQSLEQFSSRLPNADLRYQFSSQLQRLKAMTLLQRHLYQRGDSVSADMEAYTNALLNQLTSDSDIPPAMLVTTIGIDEEPVDAPSASLLGLALHELIQNALLHGFARSAPPHQLAISLSLDSNNESICWHLAVVDNGTGAMVDDSELYRADKGLGLLRTQLEGAGGNIHYRYDSGAHFEVLLPHTS